MTNISGMDDAVVTLLSLKDRHHLSYQFDILVKCDTCICKPGLLTVASEKSNTMMAETVGRDGGWWVSLDSPVIVSSSVLWLFDYHTCTHGGAYVVHLPKHAFYF